MSRTAFPRLEREQNEAEALREHAAMERRFALSRPAPEFRPLVVKEHPRQADMDAWRNLPSWRPGD